MTSNNPGNELLPAATPSPSKSPFQRPVSRRAVLAGLLGLGVGTYVDLSPLGSLTAYAAGPKEPKHKPKTTVGGAGPTQPGPYQITASSQLADDMFATNEVRIGANDEVLPFYNPASKTVEALVFSGGTLQHLHRDPAQATGWAYAAFDLQDTLTRVTSVAVAADDTRVYALLWGDPAANPTNPTGSPYWLTWLDDATTWNAGYIAPSDDQTFPPSPGPLKGGISREGVPYFYSTVVSGSTTSLVGWITTGDNNQPLVFQDLLDVHTEASGGVQDYQVLYDTAAANQVGYAFVLDAKGSLSVFPQQGETFAEQALDNAGADGVTELMWAWASPTSTTGLPGYAFQGNVPNVGEGAFFCDEQGNFTRVADAPETGSSTVAVWLADDQYTVNLLDSNGIVQTIQQNAPGSFDAPLPIANGVPGSPKPGLVAVYGVPTDPTQATLFAVGADEALSVLSLDAGGWTQTQILQDNTVAVQLTCYQVTINVQDSNQMAVRYGQAQVTTDRPVGLWQDIGSSVIVPAIPLTLTGDLRGQIIFSVPAEELDTAVLTVQALDGNGQPSGAALPVMGDYDVRNFLGGTAALDHIGTMSASTLTGAKNADGTSLLAGIDSDTAISLATGLGAAVTAGNGGTPATNAIKAYKIECHGKKLTVSTSHDAKAYGSAAVGSSLSNMFRTIGHALRHALDKIHSATVRWSTDLKHWVVDLVTDFVSWTNVYINDMRDAFHVIGGWFSTLGADIKNVVNWLKREIFGFLGSVGKNANTIEKIIGDGPDQLIGIVNGIEQQVDGWFVAQETTVTSWLTELQTAVEDATFGHSQPTPPQPTDTGGSTAMNNISRDIKWISKVVNDSPGMWLYNKLMQYLPADPGPALTGDFDAVRQDLIDAFKDSVDLGEAIVRTFWDSIKDLTSRDGFTATKVSVWFGDISAIITDGLKLADAIADTILDFVKAALNVLDDYLSYEWSLTSIDPILKLVLDEIGFDPTISIKRLVSLVTAFPLTLVRTLTGRSPVFSTSGATATSDSGDSFCYTTAAISQFIWTAADVVGDFELTVPAGSKTRGQQAGIIDYFDIVCPILQTLLLIPGRDNNLLWNGLPTDTNVPGLIPLAVLTSLISPAVGIGVKATVAAPPEPDPNVIPFYGDSPKKDPFEQYYQPIVNCLAAVANGLTAGWYGYANADSPTAQVESIVGTVLGNASYLTSPLTTWWLNESTDDVPVIVKTVIDGVAGIGAGVMYAEAA